MKAQIKLSALWKKIAAIQRMERGKLCPMRGGSFYNHQTWENGRNVVRYVPREQVADLQNAIKGYQQYLKLMNDYADQVISQTRQACSPTAKKRTLKPKSPRY